MSRECTTHHHACDCREARFRGLEAELAAMREAAQEMADAMGRGEDRELAALGKLEALLESEK